MTQAGAFWHRARTALAACGLGVAGFAFAGLAPNVPHDAPGAEAAAAGSAAALHARYEQLRPRLERNAFGRPLDLVSIEGAKVLQGDVYGVMETPFAVVERALADPANWCQILILPYNVKHCAAPSASALTLYVGKKNQDSIDRAFRLDFQFRPVSTAPDYLQRMLKADGGPLGTKNYAITLEAAPLDERRSIIHLSYSYEYGTVSRVAMQLYLSTAGSNKVGFSTTSEGGTQQLVTGMRGVMERNTMRYYLAIQAYLDSLAAPPEKQLDARLNEWYDMSEKYRRQLWEMERGEYVAMKRVEAGRLGRAPG
jgi:hypothetical protein